VPNNRKHQIITTLQNSNKVARSTAKFLGGAKILENSFLTISLTSQYCLLINLLNSLSDNPLPVSTPASEM